MGKETLYNFDYTSPTQVTRELYQDVGSGTLQVGNTRRGFKGSTDFEIWDAASGGTQLTENTDYTLGGLDSRATAAAGYNVYSNFTIDTVGYQTGNIYITYKIVGTYPNAGDTNQLRESVGVRRNAIINGDMSISQRGTSFTAIATGTYCLDRYEYNKVSSAVHTITQDTDVPSTGNFKNSLKIDCTTADTSIAAGDLVSIWQIIEGNIFYNFVGETSTLSFWVKSTKTGVYCIAFSNGIDRTYVSEYEIFITDTWEYKTITLDFDYTGGTWDYTTGTGLYLQWILAAGTNYHDTANTWNSNTKSSTSNQVNACDSVSNNFIITGIQLNIGDEALPFKHLSFDENLSRCQRYFNKTFNYEIAPAQNLGSTAGCLIGDSSGTSVGSLTINWFLKNQMRVINPTIVTYNPYAASSGASKSGSLDFPVSVASLGDNQIGLRNSDATVTAGGTYLLHATADAEL